MKSILDKCRQIKDPESGRVLLYRDEIEAVLEVDRLLHGDTISRQAAVSLPVKPKEDRYFQTCNLDDAYEYGWSDLQGCIEELPSAQLEIIRCKNCKHRHYLDNEPYCASTITFGWADDDFCSYAERREE